MAEPQAGQGLQQGGRRGKWRHPSMGMRGPVDAGGTPGGPGVLARAELERRGGARVQGSHQRVLSAAATVCVSERPPTALWVRLEAGRPVRRLPRASDR